jgi:hypothetical protein
MISSKQEGWVLHAGAACFLPPSYLRLSEIRLSAFSSDSHKKAGFLQGANHSVLGIFMLKCFSPNRWNQLFSLRIHLLVSSESAFKLVFSYVSHLEYAGGLQGSKTSHFQHGVDVILGCSSGAFCSDTRIMRELTFDLPKIDLWPSQQESHMLPEVMPNPTQPGNGK